LKKKDIKIYKEMSWGAQAHEQILTFAMRLTICGKQHVHKSMPLNDGTRSERNFARASQLLTLSMQIE
jgi:hypothetical protein